MVLRPLHLFASDLPPHQRLSLSTSRALGHHTASPLDCLQDHGHAPEGVHNCGLDPHKNILVSIVRSLCTSSTIRTTVLRSNVSLSLTRPATPFTTYHIVQSHRHRRPATVSRNLVCLVEVTIHTMPELAVCGLFLPLPAATVHPPPPNRAHPISTLVHTAQRYLVHHTSTPRNVFKRRRT